MVYEPGIVVQHVYLEGYVGMQTNSPHVMRGLTLDEAVNEMTKLIMIQPFIKQQHERQGL